MGAEVSQPDSMFGLGNSDEIINIDLRALTG
jgi:hypothetical protein